MANPRMLIWVESTVEVFEDERWLEIIFFTCAWVFDVLNITKSGLPYCTVAVRYEVTLRWSLGRQMDACWADRRLLLGILSTRCMVCGYLEMFTYCICKRKDRGTKRPVVNSIIVGNIVKVWWHRFCHWIEYIRGRSYEGNLPRIAWWLYVFLLMPKPFSGYLFELVLYYWYLSLSWTFTISFTYDLHYFLNYYQKYFCHHSYLPFLYFLGFLSLVLFLCLYICSCISDRLFIMHKGWWCMLNVMFFHWMSWVLLLKYNGAYWMSPIVLHLIRCFSTHKAWWYMLIV